MANGDADDPTAPTGRAGFDPLLANPKQSTGLTGQIERPGDQTPWWFVPGLCAVAVFFIGLLATINQDRTSDRLAAEERAAAADVDAPDPQTAAPADGPVATSAAIGAVEGTDVATTVDPLIAALPPAGSVRVDGVDHEIVSRCEVHLPFDPVDTEFQVSSYFFFDEAGERQLVDRIFDGQVEQARLFTGEPFVELEEIGDAGAFVATFRDADRADFEVVVNPGADAEPQCGDRVVTNEPGQFAEPHTRIVLDVCVDRTNSSSATISGLTTEGARFEILQPGGQLGEIVFVERGREPMRTAAPASIIRSGDATSASGVVSEGVNDLDITIDIGNDVTEADARTCVPSDLL